MRTLRNFTIRTRLMALGLLSVLAMLLIGGDGLWAMARTGRYEPAKTDRVSRRRLPRRQPLI